MTFGTRTRGVLAGTAATVLWLGLAAAPAPAAPADEPDPGRLQQSVTAVRDLALALEASVYGRPAAAGTGADLAVSSAVVDRALRATVRRRDRWRSRVWPASTVEDAVRWVAGHTPRRRSTRPA